LAVTYPQPQCFEASLDHFEPEDSCLNANVTIVKLSVMDPMESLNQDDLSSMITTFISDTFVIDGGIKFHYTDLCYKSPHSRSCLSDSLSTTENRTLQIPFLSTTGIGINSGNVRSYSQLLVFHKRSPYYQSLSKSWLERFSAIILEQKSLVPFPSSENPLHIKRSEKHNRGHIFSGKFRVGIPQSIGTVVVVFKDILEELNYLIEVMASV
jgi:hypothetical protein